MMKPSTPWRFLDCTNLMGPNLYSACRPAGFGVSTGFVASAFGLGHSFGLLACTHSAGRLTWIIVALDIASGRAVVASRTSTLTALGSTASRQVSRHTR